jgi:hypothetical protein
MSDVLEQTGTLTYVFEQKTFTIYGEDLIPGASEEITGPQNKEDDAEYLLFFTANTGQGIFTWKVEYTSGFTPSQVGTVELISPRGVEVLEDTILFEFREATDEEIRLSIN